MSVKLIRLFRSAGATGHVFFLKNGRVGDKGLAYSGFFGPMTTIAVVPTTSQILNFAINAETKDKQGVVVQGSLTVTLTPAEAVSCFDFTVDASSGNHLGEWVEDLNAKAVECVLRAVLTKVKDLDVNEAISSQNDVEAAITTALEEGAFLENGIVVGSCSIPKIVPTDQNIAEAIGAPEREKMLTVADAARHERRLAASQNDRGIQEYEVATRVELEKKEGNVLTEQAKNKKQEAETAAEATRIRLEPMQNVEASALLGAAIMGMAEGGRVGNLSITTELLAVLGKK